MAQLHHLPDLRRELISDASPSALRATRHSEAGYIVLSLWRDNLCVATSHLTPKEAGRLSTFITGGLADLAEGSLLLDPPTAGRRPILPPGIHSAIDSWRDSVGVTLETMGRRLRTSR